MPERMFDIKYVIGAAVGGFAVAAGFYLFLDNRIDTKIEKLEEKLHVRIKANEEKIKQLESKLKYLNVQDNAVVVTAPIQIRTGATTDYSEIKAGEFSVYINGQIRTQIHADASRGKFVLWDGTGKSSVIHKTWSSGETQNDFNE